MECVFCKNEDPDVFVLTWLPDGSEQVQACRDCAIEYGVYCVQHEKPHSGFSGHAGNGTVCQECVDAVILKHVGQAPIFLGELKEKLPPKEFGRITEWLDAMEESWTHLDRQAILLRGILLEAHRRRVPAREVVGGMIAQRSANAMLPFAF